MRVGRGILGGRRMSETQERRSAVRKSGEEVGKEPSTAHFVMFLKRATTPIGEKE